MKKAYASKGLWLFIICCVVFLGCAGWVFKNETVLNSILSSGEEHIATIVSKSQAAKNKNELLVVFNTNSGKTITQKTSDYVLKSDWENFETGKLVSVIYVEKSRQLFVQQALMRHLEKEKQQYFISGSWIILGIVFWILIPKNKIAGNKKLQIYL